MAHPWVVVVTVDQRGSRSGPDLVEALLTDLNDAGTTGTRVLDFERTAGDEVQGVLGDPAAAVDLALALAATGSWSVGLGTGPVESPLPRSTRAARGPAFENARRAVEAAKSGTEPVAVRGSDTAEAGEADGLLQLLVAVVRRRSPAGHEVCALLAEGLTQRETAQRLGVSKQAVSQRAQAALWTQEARVRPLAARLLRASAGRQPSGLDSPEASLKA